MYGIVLAVSFLYSVGAYFLANTLILSTRDMFIKAGLFGKDLNKTSEAKVPEGLGVICGAVFLIACFLFIPIPFMDSLYSSSSQIEFTQYICALLSICCMILLGFADDVLDLRWRHKLFLPTIATLPLLMVYLVSGGSTLIVVPKPFRPVLGYDIDLGPIVYIYMGMLAVFCTNAINILAGINGVEVGQSVVIAISIALYNSIELARYFAERHIFSLCLLFPFIGVSSALLKHNWYPSAVFVGDTFCYFAGMTFAVVGILGGSSKTIILFFIPQVLNFLYSIPQLFGMVPCPRHRLPKFNPKSDKLGMSHAQFTTDQLGPGGGLFLSIVDRLGLAKVERGLGENGNEIRVNNLTIINFVIKLIGPTHERTLTIYMMVIQIAGTVIALTVRYGLARFFYDIVK